MLALLGISTFIIYAALKMKALEAWGVAVAGSILAIVVSPGNWIGLPIGIWALVVLTRPPVRLAFAQKPAGLDASTSVPRPTTERAGDSGRRWFFTTATVVLIGIGLVLLLIVGAGLVFTTLPAFVRARQVSQEQAALALRANATVLQAFTTNDVPLAGHLTVADDAWLLDAKGSQPVTLYEIADLDVGPGALFFEADLRTQDLEGRVYLELWCRVPGGGAVAARGRDHTLSGTTGWVSSQVPLLLAPGATPDRVRLNLVVEGTGRVWIRNVKLSHAPKAREPAGTEARPARPARRRHRFTTAEWCEGWNSTGAVSGRDPVPGRALPEWFPAVRRRRREEASWGGGTTASAPRVEACPRCGRGLRTSTAEALGRTGTHRGAAVDRAAAPHGNAAAEWC